MSQLIYNVPNNNKELTKIDITSTATEVKTIVDAYMCITGLVTISAPGDWTIEQGVHVAGQGWLELASGTGAETVALDYIHGGVVKVTVQNAGEAEVTIEGVLK